MHSIELSNEGLIAAINKFDLRALSSETVEVLLHVVPTPQEVQAFDNYEKQRKQIALLSDCDRFIHAVSRLLPKAEFE